MTEPVKEVLDAYNRQIARLPRELQARECGLIALGRQHAVNFEEGREPSSGSAVQRVLAELRKLESVWLAEHAAAVEASGLDMLRARRAHRDARA